MSKTCGRNSVPLYSGVDGFLTREPFALRVPPAQAHLAHRLLKPWLTGWLVHLFLFSCLLLHPARMCARAEAAPSGVEAHVSRKPPEVARL